MELNSRKHSYTQCWFCPLSNVISKDITSFSPFYHNHFLMDRDWWLWVGFWYLGSETQPGGVCLKNGNKMACPFCLHWLFYLQFLYLGVRLSVGFESHTWLGAGHEREYTATVVWWRTPGVFVFCVSWEAINLLLETLCCLLKSTWNHSLFTWYTFLLLLWMISAHYIKIFARQQLSFLCDVKSIFFSTPPLLTYFLHEVQWSTWSTIKYLPFWLILFTVDTAHCIKWVTKKEMLQIPQLCYQRFISVCLYFCWP